MEFYKIIGALIEGVLFALLMWVGDEFILKNDNALYVYAIQATIFAVAMYLFDRFSNRKKQKFLSCKISIIIIIIYKRFILHILQEY